MTPSVTYFLDMREPVASEGNRFPLALRVLASRQSNRAYPVPPGFYYTEAEYKKLVDNRQKAPHKDTWIKIDAQLEKAREIIKSLMPFFTYKEFKERFLDDKTFDVVVDNSSIVAILKCSCVTYLKNEQYPMTVKLTDSVASILKFVNKDAVKARKPKVTNIPMRVINPEFCRKYEEYMVAKSKKQSRNGAGINLRHVRILFNDGIRTGKLPPEWYPFKRVAGEREYFDDAYVIPNEKKKKQFLREGELVEFSKAAQFSTPAQKTGHDAFMTSFLCNGCNAADFLRFKFRHIDGDFIIFYREKVKNATRSNMKPVKVYLSAELREHIKAIGNPPAPNNYIFKCYTDAMNVQEKYEALKSFTGRVSKSLKFLAINLGLDKKIKLGDARHTLANVLKKNGVDREMLKDLFGHTSIITADNYFGEFEDEQLVNVANNFISIKGIEKRLDEKLKKAS